VNWVGGNGDFTIATGSGSVTKDMQVASAGTVVFGITSPSPPPLNVTSCNFGSPVCTFTASLAGFIFSDTATGSGYTIPAQISGIATPTLYLRAVQAATTNPAVCTPAIVSAISPVDMGYTCNNPLTCQAGNLLRITNMTTNAATDIAGSPNSNPLQNSTAVSLNFDANGSAPIAVGYDDVGLITLNANKTIIPFGTATAVTLSGSSNAYVVKPHRFLLSAIQCTTADAANCGTGALAMPTAGDNPAAASAAGVTFIRAGHPFSMTVTAVNSSGNATGNYGRESSPEGVSLTPNNAVAGMVAAPAIGGSFGAFSAGAASGTAFTWGEVGIITLTPAVGDADYLGAGNVTGTTSGNVGRFYPEHFDTVITQVAGVPMACPTGLTCPADYNGFVYSGQEFSVSVTAKNATGATTANYNTTTGFAKSTALSAFGVLGTTTAVSGAGTLGLASVTAFAAGTLTDATQKYTFTTAETAPSNIYIRADDGEATSLRALNPATTSVEGGVAVASGRIKVSNAYGSELLPLQLSATAQYYNAGGWLTSTTDSNTNLILLASYPAGTGTTAVTLTPVSSILSAGKLTIKLAKPTNGAGVATISPVAPTYLPVIQGRATFGVYKGSNDVFIYQRESY
jgi:MSHA biogenesis protein MshQ